jgi:hypothetical protein
MTKEQSESIHAFCINNREEILSSTTCGCFFCQTVFYAQDVKEYVGARGDRALCPLCGIDSVLPGRYVVLTTNVLKEMHDYWFKDKKKS